MRFGSIMLCAALAPMLVAADPPVRLQPSSPWDVDYGANSCRLMRTFGDGQNTTSLLFESPAPGSMTLLLVGHPLKTGVREVSGKFHGEDAEPMTGRLAQSTQGDTPAILFSDVELEPEFVMKRLRIQRAEAIKHKADRPPPINLDDKAAFLARRKAFASAVTGIEIDTRHDHSVILETGSLGEPIKIFDLCMRDALKDWGVDPDIEDKIVRPPWPLDRTRWLEGEDYPRDMIMRNQESEVSARLLVDATGKPTSCTPLSYFKESDFSKLVCTKMMARARFEPAELADGTKVSSYYTAHVIFEIRP